MSRIIGIDYGLKRIGISVTDPLQIIVSGLTTVATVEIMDYLKDYLKREEVEGIVVGFPRHLDGNPTQIAPNIESFIKKINKQFPEIWVETQDERFTSSDAKRIILQSGVNRKKRQDKRLVDKISAVLILQDYLGH